MAAPLSPDRATDALVVRRGGRVYLRYPQPTDRETFRTAWEASEELFDPWLEQGDADPAFGRLVERNTTDTECSLLVCRQEDDAFAGVYNLSQIFLGAFRNAYLGYYAFAPLAGRGYMREGLELVKAHAFEDLGLHRLQANVQPANIRSNELLRAAGFRLEGLAPRYLMIRGGWRDHLMWALTADEDPVIAAHGSVTLHDVTSMNWRAVATIEVEPRQREWVADVPRYLALCRYGGSWNPLAILAGADTVGFAMWARDPDAARYWIGGLVIDHRRQRSGYGGDALDAMIGYLADMPDCEAVALSYLPENVVARRLYSSHGFTETGEMEGDEIVAQLDLRRWA